MTYEPVEERASVRAVRFFESPEEPRAGKQEVGKGHRCTDGDEICYAPRVSLPPEILPECELAVLELIERTDCVGVCDKPVCGLLDRAQNREPDAGLRIGQRGVQLVDFRPERD